MADDFDAAMEAMPPEWRYRWCGGNPRDRGEIGACACLGCANNAGRLGYAPETYDRWRAWVSAHPKSPELIRDEDPWAMPPERLRDPSRLPQ